MKLTIALITSRNEPRFDWFFQSLGRQLLNSNNVEIIVVDFFAQSCDAWTKEDVEQRGNNIHSIANAVGLSRNLKWVPPMPSVWQGPHRLTKENWWAMAAARNTSLCLARGEWLLALDDRCVLQPGFMNAVRENIQTKRAYFGSYEKRTSLTVEDGLIKNAGIVIGTDQREEYVDKFCQGAAPWQCPGEWSYGCCGLYPTEWLLDINGWCSSCDGLSMEDIFVGIFCFNRGLPTAFDKRMKMIEDRTPEFCTPVMKRQDKGQSPNDRSHAVLNMLKGRKEAMHPINLRQIRDSVLVGNPFPPPYGPTVDFWDQQPVSEM